MQSLQISKQKLQGYLKVNLRNIFWVTTIKLSVTTICDFSSLDSQKLTNSKLVIA